MKAIRNTAVSLFMSALLLSGLSLTGEVIAHGGASGVVKERMDLMKSMGERMKEMAAMVKGKSPFDATAMAEDAREIEQTAPQINRLFPRGSLHKPSEALPSIWETPEKFNQLSDRLVQEAGNLKDAAITGDRRSIVVQFSKVGKTCSACHTDFREKQAD